MAKPMKRTRCVSKKEDVLTALRGGMPRRIPWTTYQNMLPRGEAELALRSQGLALVFPIPLTSPDLYQWGPNVEIAERTIVDNGQALKRITYRTPVGELTELKREGYAPGMAGFGSAWMLEFMIKRPSDYEILEYLVREQKCTLNNEAIIQTQMEAGDDGIVVCKTGKVPFQLLWMEYTGMERICEDLADNPEPVERVMQAMIERDRALWKAIAASPAEVVSCSDNISADLVSPKLFEKHFLPYYAVLAEIVNLKQRPLVIHCDGLIRGLAQSIKQLPKGVVIEAFTPPPMFDYSIAEARAEWGDRPIWINFPSSVHLSTPEEVEAVTREILRQAAPGNGFLIGMTENMPARCWPQSMAAIGRVLNKYGKCPLKI